MKYFMRVASICQVIFVEIIATACMASVFANILGMFMLFGCEKIGKIDGYFIFSLLLGIFCLYLFVRDVAKPHLGKEAIRPLIKINKISVPVPLLGKTPYEFPSTHPATSLPILSLFYLVFFSIGLATTNQPRRRAHLNITICSDVLLYGFLFSSRSFVSFFGMS